MQPSPSSVSPPSSLLIRDSPIFYSLYFLHCSSLGCTPLHWAAIRGNLEACTVLVQAGKKEDLMVTDNSGFTPAQLASDKNHRQVAFFLVGIPCLEQHSFILFFFFLFGL